MMTDARNAYPAPFGWRFFMAIMRFPPVSVLGADESRPGTSSAPSVLKMRDQSRHGVADACAAGDRLRRFQQTIVPHLDAAYNFARFLSRDADAAQDIVQDAFLRAYRGFEHYRGGDPRSWTFAIVRNCYHAWLQQGRRRGRYETPMTDGGDAETQDPSADRIASQEDSPEMTMIRKSESQRVRDVMNTLSDPMREILVLRELEELSYRQIAEITEVPIGTVMSRLARARREFGDAWNARQRSEATP
ncbi:MULTISPECIES: sigma-70 family RNA polymerase sigma factor [unclassified Sinorhizobium]|uniref:sigma-70 family RNA polymerase sigma factor n=1 Tax=unclassified Sinorhizobium TaxID=2613772 RepID=UPI0035245962